MAMQYDGKTYRNLQEQVAYLTGKWKELADEIEELRAQIPSKMIVEELPETGDPLITYYVGPKGTAPNQYYEVWIWVQEEPEGPFVWRELEDTDQVDLSGYLPIVDDTTTLPQVYGKNEAGNQLMINVDIAATPMTVLFRDTNGRTKVAAPSADGDAANKKFVEDNFVAKATGASANAQAYAKAADGTQTRLDVSVAAGADTIPIRDGIGQVKVANTPVSGNDAVSKDYADGHYVAKQTGSTDYGQIYGKTTSGEQTMWNVNGNPVADSVPLRFAYGHIKLPNEITYPPTNDDYAVSKRYVDQVVGQLLYLHDIEIIVQLGGINELYIKAYLINDDSTAISSIDQSTFKRMDISYGAIFDNPTYTPCSVTKLPYSFVHDEFDHPSQAYLYQYISGGSLVSGATDTSMTVTFTDSVISF